MIIPARGYCLIQAEEADEVSAGGVILAERMKDMPQKGKVLAVGEDTYEMTMFPSGVPTKQIMPRKSDWKVRDTVIFKRFVDNRIKEEGKELLLVPFQDILGVYE